MHYLNYALYGGHGFSLSERTALEATAYARSGPLRLGHMAVWGKVFGVKNDYIVIRGEAADGSELDGVLYYSTNGGQSFTLLDGEVNQRCLRDVGGPYMGDPAYEYVIKGDGEEPVIVKERVRLATWVQYVDHHCRLVLRGAVVLHTDGQVKSNPAFEGLSLQDCLRPQSLLHLRRCPTHEEAKRCLVEGTRYETVDVLAPITADVPYGCWSIRQDPLNNVVYATTPKAQGFVFYCAPDTPEYGNLYVGDGCPNNDLAFYL